MDALRLSERLGDLYSVTREVGRGGMAKVFLARDRKHDRDVAVKVLLPELADTVAVQRFEQEIRMCVRA